MKFWQKTFLGILAVFIVFINICLYLTSSYSFSLNLNRDRDRALGEYGVIMNGIGTSLNSMAYREKMAADVSGLVSLMRSYADYYLKQGVYFELRQVDQTVFSNIPAEAAVSIGGGEASDGTYAVRPISGGGTNYLSISGRASGGTFTLVYLRDLSPLYLTHAQLTRYLLLVSGTAEILLALVIFLLLKKLTQPIAVLQSAAKRIAGGDYGKRIDIRGRDEFRDLSDNFNQMAAAIGEKLEALDKNARDKQRLIDNLAHELRTPLTAIRGYAEYLRSANAGEESRIEAADTIVREADRMKSMAFKLLDLALVRNNEPEITEISPFKPFLDEIRDSAMPRLSQKNIALKIEYALDNLTADEVLLRSLLLNLIDNAAGASENGSEIVLAAYSDGVPVLEVRDSGCGMTEEQLALVCEPFYRADKARARGSGGVGLGLALVSEIVRLHGAELKIESAPGKGTAVRIIFTTSLQPSENSEIDPAV